MRTKPYSTNIATALTAIVAAMLAVAIASPSYAATLTVCASGCTDTTIAAAIATASPGDTISIQDAVHTETNITVDRNLTIQGQGAASTAIDGGGNGPIFTVNGGVTATIWDMTIRNGSGFLGGGIFNGGTVTLSNSTLSGNSASFYGGGIFNVFGTATISNSTLSGNSASFFGGGILNEGAATISNSSLSGNSASSIGGGIANFVGATVKNSIVGNSSGGDCFSFSPITAVGANLDTDGSCGITNFTQVTSAQLNLGPLALNAPGTTETLALLLGSVAINAAPDCTDVLGNPVTTDQRGA